MSAFIITASLLLAGAFVLAWIAGPELRRRIERPKHLFAEQVQQYDEQCRQDGAPPNAADGDAGRGREQ